MLVFSGRFEQLLTFSGVVMIGFSALTVASVFIHRVRGRGEPLPYSGRGYPWTAAVFLVVSIWILLISFRDQPKEAFSGLAVVASGVPFYFYWRRKRSHSDRSSSGNRRAS
jgi:APA family basic amino acid/polyamine antiporter